MSKTFDQFGGWLKFFQICNYIGIVVGGLMTLYVILNIGKVLSKLDVMGSIVLILSLIYEFIIIILFYKMVDNIEERHPSVVEEINQYFKIIFVSTIILMVLNIFLIFYIKSGTSNIFAKNILRTGMNNLVYCSIWMTYFKISKRVKEYYKID